MNITRHSAKLAAVPLLIGLALAATGCQGTADAAGQGAPQTTAAQAATPSPSPSATPTPSGTLMPQDPDSKYLKDMTAKDIAVDPSFVLDEQTAGSAAQSALALLHVFTDEFPRYQTASFPDAMIGDLLHGEVEPKLRPLVTEQFWKDEANRFIAANGSSMILTGILGGSDAPHVWKLTGGNSCTATDEPFDVRYTNGKLKLERDPQTGAVLGVVSVTGIYIIQCTEGKPLYVKMDTTIKSTFDGTQWLANEATRSRAYDMQLLTPLK